MNPLMQGMGKAPAALNPQMIQQIKQMMNALNAVQNPQQALAQIAQKNPALNSVLQMVGGRSPKAVFYEQCRQMGVNPDDVISQLR